MTSYSDAGGPARAFGGPRWQGGGCAGMFRWKPLEIAAIVIGFMIWWPVGLGLLGLKVAQRRGYSFDDAASLVRRSFGSVRSSSGPQWRPFDTAATGNAAFDEWRASELAKLDEERRKLDEARREFGEHLDNLRRARDRDEFDGFMRAREQSRTTPNS